MSVFKRFFSRSVGIRVIQLVLGLVSLNAYSIDVSTLSTLADNSNSIMPSVLTKTYTLRQLGWNSAVTLNGFKPDYTLYFPTNPQYKLLSISMHLKMAFSPSLALGTRVEIKLNQNNLRNLTMPIAPNAEQAWDIDLPLTQLTADWQAINFSGYLVSQLSLCSPDIWIYVSPESTLTFSYEPLPFNSTLNKLPFPFINPLSIDTINTLLILPEQANREEIMALFRVAQQLGVWAKDAKIQLSTSTINEVSNAQANNNIIAVGLADKLLTSKFYPGLPSNPTQMNEALESHSGVMSLSGSKLNPFYAVLTLTGADNSALQKTMDALNINHFQLLTAGTLAVIKKASTKPVEPTEENWEQVTFKDLGYPNQTVLGLGTQKLTYSLSLPNTQIPQGAQLKTYITSPVQKSGNISQITLVVNGQKQAVFKLTKAQSAWVTPIESFALKPGVNRLDYLMDLHLENETCARRDYNEVWATIHNESIFEAHFTDVFPHTNLNQLPVPYDDDFSIILPENLTSTEINRFTQLFFKLGALFNSDKAFNILLSQEVDEEFIRNHNIILLGTPQTNQWITFALEFLPVKIEGNMQVLNSEDNTLEVGDAQAQGLLEITHSPWSQDHAVLLITGNNELALSWAINTLIDDAKRQSLNGNIVLIHSDQTLSIIDNHSIHFYSLAQRIQLYLVNSYKNKLYYLKNHPQVLIYLVVFVVPIVIYWRRRKK